MGDRLSDERGTRREDDGGGAISEAILLCGGRGSRLGGDVEKPLVEVGGVPLVDRVLAALATSRLDRVVAIPSPMTPATTRHLRERAEGRKGRVVARDDASDVVDPSSVELVVRPGDGNGYVEDLSDGLSTVDGPAVTVAADLPLLRGSDIDEVIGAATAEPIDRSSSVPSVAVCVPVGTKRALGVSIDTVTGHEGRPVAPTGLNVVADGSDRVIVRDRLSLAVNVNRPTDLAVARRLAAEE
ncbi:NTP transferase domain-containing protein [Halorubrum vacuolatum]|uniref:Adenosylcobinamide-phosphate guanylyltransferase n=1 Tax=Halorubrum vacuolatum TaxID=63740 RepID=A0A238XUT5_HALVU|nr:NTP transferase domain-containing protein [Halorubrum vacuolatum]SNR62308.1 adenosylcobinamide-phosphate guanylyltransferase [Halorubrum vacuolatum]